MNSAFRIWLALLLLLAIILLSICQQADAAGSYDTNLRIKRQSASGRRICDCRYANDSPVCASNGVTYPSMCRFNCAKEKVKRLRMVSNGSCRGKSLTDYRRGQKRQN